MANYSIRLDLQKMPGAFLADIKGKTMSKKCICIPIEDARLFVGAKGTYADLSAIEVKDAKYEDTHLIKMHLPKPLYDEMSEEERKAQPIIGGLHEMRAATQEVDNVASVDNDDDLPF